MVHLNRAQLSSGDVATVLGYLNVKKELEKETQSMAQQEEGETTQSRCTRTKQAARSTAWAATCGLVLAQGQTSPLDHNEPILDSLHYTADFM